MILIFFSGSLDVYTCVPQCSEIESLPLRLRGNEVLLLYDNVFAMNKINLHKEHVIDMNIINLPKDLYVELK